MVKHCFHCHFVLVFFSTKFYFKIGLKLYLFMQKNNVFIEQNLILKMGLKLYLCMQKTNFFTEKHCKLMICICFMFMILK